MLLFLSGALDSHPFFPSHVASDRCVVLAGAAKVNTMAQQVGRLVLPMCAIVQLLEKKLHVACPQAVGKRIVAK